MGGTPVFRGTRVPIQALTAMRMSERLMSVLSDPLSIQVAKAMPTTAKPI